jgi:thiol:disulfide interchange protein
LESGTIDSTLPMINHLLLFYFLHSFLGNFGFTEKLKLAYDTGKQNEIVAYNHYQTAAVSGGISDLFAIKNKKATTEDGKLIFSNKGKDVKLKAANKPQNISPILGLWNRICAITKSCLLAFWQGLTLSFTTFALLFTSIKIHDLLFVGRRKELANKPSRIAAFLSIFSTVIALTTAIYLAEKSTKTHIFSAFQEFYFVLFLSVYLCWLMNSECSKRLVNQKSANNGKFRMLPIIAKFISMDVIVAVIAYPKLVSFFRSIKTDLLPSIGVISSTLLMLLGFISVSCSLWFFVNKLKPAKLKSSSLLVIEMILLALALLFLGFVLSWFLSALTMMIIAITVVISLVLTIFNAGNGWKYTLTSILFVMVSFLISFDRRLIKHDKNLDSHWTKLELREMDIALNRGQVVVVKVTAAWCALCNINNILLQNKDFISFANLNNVVLMQADMSGSNDISLQQFLSIRGVYELPFLAIFSPLNPGGRMLGSLILPGELETEISKENEIIRNLDTLRV